jgi:hypothetical protein
MRNFAYYARNGGSRSSQTDDFQQSSISLAAAIHKAIRDGEYVQLPDLVTHPELLWEANSTGWTAVHYAASHFLPVEWWEWILERAVAVGDAAERFMTCKNALGQSVIDVFLRSYLEPLPWQSIQVKNRSRLLREGSEKVCAQEALQNAVQAWILHSRTAGAASDFFHRPDVTTRDPQAVRRVVRFLTALDLLGRATVHESLVYRSDLNTLSFLASAGSCSKEAADLVLALNKNAAKEPSVDGSLALHLWAASHTYCLDQDGLLKPLLNAYPEAAALPDKDGRLPLHLALESGKSWARIRPLFEIYPDALHLVDRCTGLTAAALAAVADQDSVEIRAQQRTAGDKGLVSMWNLVPIARKQEARQKAADELSCERLTTIYQVLRAFPQVLCSHAVETEICGQTGKMVNVDQSREGPTPQVELDQN